MEAIRRSLLAVSAVAFLWLFTPADATIQTYRAKDYKLDGPFIHNNLAVFLIRGKEQSDDLAVITLEESMKTNLVRINETGNVGELTAENLSPDRSVFIHAGDILKGGKQDRTISQDLLLPPRSGPVALKSLCVEQGRWTKRGQESQARFSLSSRMLSSKDLKIATRAHNNQNAVWNAVGLLQSLLGNKLNNNVRSRFSNTSLQLTLENDIVNAAAANYVQALAPSVRNKPDVIGYGFFINGTFNSIELYSSNRLFLSLWPKLLLSNAMEAVASLDNPPQHHPVDPEDIEDALADIELHEKSLKTSRNIDKGFFFDTQKSHRNKNIHTHRTYIAK